ncbi:serine/threonine protein kinase [Oscillochloris trichoides DG-6]|uniref:Serine/threonine protein kinase n=1 Tax=Oscillochloris trichoides DG-6 TaxID=765420 RepID=E1IFR6_9CHLR|nr:serine/threonine protein kinase [Oscillochloris trichoides DG-6]
MVFLGACSVRPQAAQLPGQLIPLDHCIIMLIGPERWKHATRSGSYLLTPGWLRTWRAQIAAWGFKQEIAREFFQETTKELVLLDTGVDPDAATYLAELAAFVDCPSRIEPIGLDYLRLYLRDLILTKRIKRLETHQREVLKEANRKIAEYAMAFDLLIQLSSIQSEEATIHAIRDLFAMLFGCSDPTYAQVRGGQMVQFFPTLPTFTVHSIFEQLLVATENDYILIDEPAGFYLRIQYQHESMGLIAISNIAFPHHRDQYLSLALAITNLCGLALANARTFSMLQEAEQALRYEREITEHLRQTMSDLTSDLDQEQMLHKVMVQLEQLIPHQMALILLREGVMLRVASAQNLFNDARLIGTYFAANQQPFAAIIQRKKAIILNHDQLANLTLLEPELTRDIRTWMGVPLLQQEGVIGILIVASTQVNAYSANHVMIAQVLAHEVVIALQNVRMFQEMHTLAGTDPLTRLYNRRRLTELAEAAFRHAQKTNGNIAAIFIDIDHFKDVNDTFGHGVGDKVLEYLASLLRQVRSSDIVARYGGEEFVIISIGHTTQHVRLFAERLRQEVAQQPVNLPEGQIAITISLGVASLTPQIESLAALLRFADQALYQAKTSGRNRVCVWGETA